MTSKITGTSKVKIEGRDHLKKLPREFQIKHLYKTLFTSANEMRKAAISLAPDSRKTPAKSKGKKREANLGRISEFIRRRRFGLKDGADNPTVGVGVLSRGGRSIRFPRHWYIVHFGSKKQKAQPFLLHAFDRSRDASLSVFGKEAGKNIEFLKKKYSVGRYFK